MLDREPKNDLHEQKGLHNHCRAGSTNAYNLSAKKINTVALLCATEFYLFLGQLVLGFMPNNLTNNILAVWQNVKHKENIITHIIDYFL